jgi:hypothetical protein
MDVVPGSGPVVCFPAREYRTLLRWWLGLPLFSGDSAQCCPFCSDSLDPYGDHLVSCRFNKLTERHNDVRKALAMVLQSLGISCNSEETLPSSFERPGDLALPFLDARGKLLIDLSACHPLAPGRTRDQSCLSAVADRELHKLAKYESKCQSAGYLFSPLGFNLWGGFGPLGTALLRRIVRHLVGDSQGWVRSHRTALLWNRLSSTLMHAVSRQLLPALDVVPSFHLPPGLFRDPASLPTTSTIAPWTFPLHAVHQPFFLPPTQPRAGGPSSPVIYLNPLHPPHPFTS